ncbi:MAG: ABC transporter substrate-binding protein [Candidatus Dormibacteria bacterium]
MVTAACGGGPASSGGSAARQPLNVALVNGTIQAFYPYLAVQEGLFAKRGIDASLISVQTGPQLITALIGGNADIAMAGPQLLWPTLQRGSDIKVLVGAVKLDYMLVSCPGTTLTHTGEPFPKQLQDLKGRSIGVIGPGTQVETFAKTLVTAAGLQPGTDVKLVTVGGNATGIPACLDHRVDFDAINPPQNVRLGVPGKDYTIVANALDPLTTGDLFKGFFADTYSAAGPFLSQHQGTVNGFCQVMVDARAFATNPSNIDKVASLFAAYEGVPLDAARQAFEQNANTLLVPITQSLWDRQGQSIAGSLHGYTPSYQQFTYPQCSTIIAGNGG